MQALDRKTKLRLTGWLLHGAGVLSLAAGAVTCHVVTANVYLQRRNANDAEAARLAGVLETSRETYQEHRRLSGELAQLERNAETMRLRIPDQPQEAEFLRQVTQTANATQLRILNYERKSVIIGKTHAEFDIRLNCCGAYDSICKFLDRLGQLPRVTVVKKLNILARDNPERYPVDMTLTLYCRSGAAPGNG